MNNLESGLKARIVLITLALIIVGIVFLVYRDILTYQFTGTDSHPIIYSSRIESLNDLGKVFLEPLMSGTGFVDHALFYRPTTRFFYSLDYSNWEWDPFGYHLTDLVLHSLVSVFTFLMVLSLTKGNRIMAFLSAVIFATHPVNSEILPVIARRQDMIVTLFLVLSLLLFLYYIFSQSSKFVLLILSLFLYVFALGAKETAVILPVLIFAYVFIYSYKGEEPQETVREKGTRALKTSAPYVIITFLYIIWRTIILKGVGGYVGEIEIVTQPINIIRSYFFDLVDPALLLRSAFQIESVAIIVSISIIAAVLIFYRHGRKTMVRVLKEAYPRDVRISALLISTSIALSLMLVVIYIFVFTVWLRDVLSFMTGFKHVADLSLAVILFALIISLGLIAGVHRYDRIEEFLINVEYGKDFAFSLVWLLLPLFLYLFIRIFFIYYLYLSVIPFAIITSMLFVRGLYIIVPVISRKLNLLDVQCRLRIEKVTRVMVGLFSLTLVAYLPHVQSYAEWGYSAQVVQEIMEQTLEVVSELPGNATMYMACLPSRINNNEGTSPTAIASTYLMDYTIKTYLDQRYPQNQIEIVVLSRAPIAKRPDEINLKVKNLGVDQYLIIVDLCGPSGTRGRR